MDNQIDSLESRLNNLETCLLTMNEHETFKYSIYSKWGVQRDVGQKQNIDPLWQKVYLAANVHLRSE